MARRQVADRLRGRRSERAAGGPARGAADLDDAAEVTRVWRACERHDDGEALLTEEDFVAIFRGRASTPRETPSGSATARPRRRSRSCWARATCRRTCCRVTAGAGSARGCWAGPRALRGRAATTCRARASPSTITRRAALLRGRRLRGALGVVGVRDRARRRAGSARGGGPYALRPFVPGQDDRAVHRVIDDAFGEWRGPRRGCRSRTGPPRRLGRPGFAPEHVAVAVRDGEIVGAVVMIVDAELAWVAQLAVAAPHRGRGLARGAARARVRDRAARRVAPLRRSTRTRGPGRAASTSTSGCASSARSRSTPRRSDGARDAAPAARRHGAGGGEPVHGRAAARDLGRLAGARATRAGCR